MLVIAPLHDIPTIASTKMAFQIFELLDDCPEIKLKYLNGIFATKPSIYNELHTHHYDFIVYFGHGRESEWVDGILMDAFTKEDPFAFKGSIVYTMACYSAKEFGEELVRHGTIAYIGNTETVFAGVPTFEERYDVDFTRIHHN